MKRDAMSKLVRDNHTGRYVRTRITYWTPETWDDGFVDPKGYFRVYRPDHPRATPAGWVHRYQVVWWLKTGSPPPDGWDIHHSNEIKLDDVYTNLELKLHGEHTAHHSSKPYVQCICTVCGESFAIPQWRINEGKGKFCSQSCYHRKPKSDLTRQRQSNSQRRAHAEGRR